MLNIHKTLDGDRAVVALEGRLDTVTSPELEQTLRPLAEQVTDLTLDFAALDYISSAGLRVLLTVNKQLARRGTMRLIHVAPMVLEILEVTGFTEILNIV